MRRFLLWRAPRSRHFDRVTTDGLAGVTLPDIPAWEGQFSTRGMDVKAMCPLCESASGATLSHLVVDCPAAGRISAGLLHGVGEPSQENHLTVEMFENPSTTDVLNAVLQLSEAWRLAMSDQLRERQRRQTHGSPREQQSSLGVTRELVHQCIHGRRV